MHKIFQPLAWYLSLVIYLGSASLDFFEKVKVDIRNDEKSKQEKAPTSIHQV